MRGTPEISRNIFARRTGRARIVVAWMGVWALALHALIPLAQGFPGLRDVPGQPPGLVLCLALSAKSGPAGEKRMPGDDDRRACPICQINALGKSYLPALAVVSPATPHRRPEWRPPLVADVVGTSPRPWRARAPPRGA